jgi:hypothetical protein
MTSSHNERCSIIAKYHFTPTQGGAAGQPVIGYADLASSEGRHDPRLVQARETAHVSLKSAPQARLHGAPSWGSGWPITRRTAFDAARDEA